MQQWRSQPKIFWGKIGGPQCLTSGEQQYFCLGRRFSKHKMTRYAKYLGPPGYVYVQGGVNAAHVTLAGVYKAKISDVVDSYLNDGRRL